MKFMIMFVPNLYSACKVKMFAGGVARRLVCSSNYHMN